MRDAVPSFGVSGRASPISSSDSFGALEVGGLISDVLTAKSDFSAFAVPGVDRLLLDLLLSFSPFPAITNSAFFNSRRCLLRMRNQKIANEANATTTTGTTIAGMRVLKFEEDFEDAAAVDDDFAAVEEALSPDEVASDVEEEVLGSSLEAVTVSVCASVIVVGVPSAPSDIMVAWLVTVVMAEGDVAVTILETSVTEDGAPMLPGKLPDVAPPSPFPFPI